MTTMNTDIMDELSAMEDLIDQADARRSADRNPNIPVGAPLSKTDLGGGSSIIQTKQDSLAVTANGTPLPGRTPVYYRLGANAVRWVDTGRLAHHLAKRVNGERVFSLKPWPVDPPKVYEKTCDICLNGPDHVRKVFVEDVNGDGETKYIAHMQSFHQMQWETIQRQIDRDERREEQALLREMLATIARKDGSPTATDVEELVQQRLAEMLAEASNEQTTTSDSPSYTETCECGEAFSAAAPGVLANKLRLHRAKAKVHKTVEV